MFLDVCLGFALYPFASLYGFHYFLYVPYVFGLLWWTSLSTMHCLCCHVKCAYCCGCGRVVYSWIYDYGLVYSRSLCGIMNLSFIFGSRWFYCEHTYCYSVLTIHFLCAVWSSWGCLVCIQFYLRWILTWRGFLAQRPDIVHIDALTMPWPNLYFAIVPFSRVLKILDPRPSVFLCQIGRLNRGTCSFREFFDVSTIEAQGLYYWSYHGTSNPRFLLSKKVNFDSFSVIRRVYYHLLYT